MKHVSARLETASLDRAIKELKDYEKWVRKKARELIDRMVKHGEDYAVKNVGHVDTGATINSIHGYRRGNMGVIVAGGNAIWIEFGTGAVHNAEHSYPNPYAQKLGMSAIGEYKTATSEQPKGRGLNKNGWYYFDGARVRHTRGIKAQMFMKGTVDELLRKMPEFAREVFET